MKTRRELLLERLSNYHTVPGHGPDITKLSDDELEIRVKLLDAMFEAAYQAKHADDHEDDI
ncbi:hypothetical protein ACI2LM_15545 [Paenibacillus lautus]|uniref:hypothetical protein n=1 Tax=Paenibacillus lautus TaxID=1401 RepID=UPI00384D3E03